MNGLLFVFVALIVLDLSALLMFRKLRERQERRFAGRVPAAKPSKWARPTGKPIPGEEAAGPTVTVFAPGEWKLQVGFVAWGIIMLNVVIFLWMYTRLQGEVENIEQISETLSESMILTVFLFFLVFGILFFFLLRRQAVQADPFLLKDIDPKSYFAKLALGVVVGLVAAFGAQKVLASTAVLGSLSEAELAVYHMAAGVAEEVFFSAFLTTALFQLPSQWIPNPHVRAVLASVGRAAVFTAYHVFAYSGQEGALQVIFVLGLIFSLLYLYTRLLDTPLAVHVIMNTVIILQT